MRKEWPGKMQTNLQHEAKKNVSLILSYSSIKHNLRMMTKRFFAALLFGALLSMYAVSQDRTANPPDTADYPYWIDMMQDPEVNFYDVVEAFETYWEGREVTKGSGFKPFKRWEYKMRMSGIYPDGTRKPADYYRNEYFRYLENHPGSRSANGNWISLGPEVIPDGKGYKGLGRLNAIAFHPTDPDIIYVGSPSGGLWVTTVGGNEWTGLTDDQPTLGVSAIIVDYNNPDLIYLGTGDRDAGDAFGLGVFRSTDAGETWEEWSNGMGDRTVGRLIQHPTNHLLILAATNGGVYRTVDGGANWTLVQTGNFKEILFKPGDPTTVYAAASGNVFKSTNGGQSFTMLTNGLPGGNRAAIAVTPADPNYVYVILTNGDSFKGLYRSTDNGASFTEQSTQPNIMSWGCNGGSGGQAWYDLDIAADPNDANVIFAGGVNCFKSVTGGTIWNISSHWWGDCGVPAVHADLHVMEYNPINDRLYAGNDGGIYYTDDQGATWHLISNGLVISQVYKIGQSVTVRDKCLNGYQDNGTSTYLGNNWQFTRGGDGMECAVDPKDAAYSYATVYYGNIDRYYNNNYQANVASNGNYGLTEDGGWITPFCIDEENPNIMFVGYKNVWRCDNVKAPSSQIQWRNITASLGFSGTNMRVLEQSPADPGILFLVRENDQVYRTDNARDDFPAWANITTQLPTGENVRDIECHPENPDIVYLSKNNKIYRSENRGQSWEDISGTLPNVTFTSIAYYKNAHEGLYISSDIGVYYKDAFMTDWVMFSNGLPVDASINEVEIYIDPADPAQDIIRAGTYGRGMWESDMYHAAPLADFTASETVIPAGCIIDFTDMSSGVPTQWQWTFEGATPSTSDERNPQGIVYNTLGTFQVTLAVMNEAGSDTLTVAEYITVSDTVMPAVAFGADRTNVCIDGIVRFTDSTAYCPDTWLWEFSPGTVSFKEGTSAASQHPVVEFRTSGIYTVTLTATNSNGQNTLVKTDYIQAGGYSLPFEEDFELSSLEDRSWTVVNPDYSNTWSLFDIEEAENTAAQMKFYGYFNLGARDQLISPFLNFSGMDEVYLTFDHAYAQRFSQKDSLIVYISDDCGETWMRIWANGPDGSGIFATFEPTPYEFIPTESVHWCGEGWGAECTTLDLTQWAGETDMQLMFEGYNNLGNNLYIDNVMISNTTGSGEIIPVAGSFSIYPNPGNGLFSIDVTGINGDCMLQVYNTQGQLVNETAFTGERHRSAIDLREMPAGIYVARLLSHSGVQVRKIIIE